MNWLKVGATPCAVGAAFVVAALFNQTAKADPGDEGPVKIYLMAGQSNMVGWGNWYQNDGVTLHPTLIDPTDPYPLTQTDVDFYSVPLDQVWVAHPEGGQTAGALKPGFGGTSNTIGIELSLGHELAGAYDNPFYLFKSDKGGTTLAGNWRPPSAATDRGGDVGELYISTVRQFHNLLNDFESRYPEYNDRGFEIAGFVWLQGWNEYGNDAFRAEYQENLVDLVENLRADLGVADLPVIISDAPRDVTVAAHEQIAAAKQAAVAELNAMLPGSAVYVDSLGIDPETGQQFFHWNYTASNYVEMGKRIAAGAQSVMRTSAVNHDGDANIAAAWNGFRDTYSRVVRYEMDEADGTTIFNTAGGRMVADAVLSDVSARATTGLGPDSTGSINAADGVIRATNDFGNFNQTYTLGAWIRLDALADAQGQYVIMSSEDADGAGSDTGWNFGVERKLVGGEWTNYLFFDLRHRNGMNSLNDSDTGEDLVLDAERDYFVAFVRDVTLGSSEKDNTLFYLYDPLTETLIASDGGSSETQKATTFRNIRIGIGVDDYFIETNTLFQGLIDDAQIWDLALSEADILALAKQGSLAATLIPEPTTLALLAAGSMMLLRRRRRRR